MNYLIGIIFIALIGYIFEQRRHIKFLEQVNHNQETHDVMTAHQLELTRNKVDMLELTLNTIGYNVERFEASDFTKREPSQEQLQEIWAEYQQLERKSRSAQVKFEAELELRGVE
ncbi:hypothetical protein [Leuconostoc citreum]|uniref:Uncharacterized protein n=2 Tax=Leuconostoc citreum TaxID=33964 RepID=B1MWK3_LEUCK|nr:hypothetical protein [Leuconostoc citreum]ACA81925.1 Hypothetical protein LCK_00092 [Leuconostoc citreum KM20]KAF0260513.1 hypothetical protein CRI81_06440 [Leuconostoc citreum]MCP1275930.1 hypothetical protein [Leuconostoc citreum]MDV8932251.1 hypothetical protein [Leuconostoc citreum]QGN60956.1 hypothetical protein GJ636_06315 [Leuconostoc citreum]